MPNMMKFACSLSASFFLLVSFCCAQDHSHMQMDMDMKMPASMYGAYTHTREASGTAWQPDSSPMEGWHFSLDDWELMAHGFADLVYDDQGGKRGDSKLFSPNMFMLMGARPLASGRFGFRSMTSLEPLMGKSGYPLLLQSGETADGQTELVDRQHPHDLFMELALTYSLPLSSNTSLFTYFGLPGEPALGPAAFMHRASGSEIPSAPITHHWLDSTHITYGVVTAGYVYDAFKLEGSVFNGSEPDQHRYDIETGSLDSFSGRASYNISSNISTQISYGSIQSPEQLHPQVDVERYTASATYNLPLSEGNWASTFAWGSNNNDPGDTLNAFLFESSILFANQHTLFTRVENVEKNELLDQIVTDHGESAHAQSFRVNRVGLGYIYDLPALTHLKVGVGAETSISILGSTLERFYGDDPLSFQVFVRAKLI